MMKIERFLDTKEKRTCFFHILYVLLSFCVIYTYLQTAYTILSIDSYEDMFFVLTSGAMERSYLARLVLQCMSLPGIDISSIVWNALQVLHFIDLAFIVFTIGVLFADVYQDVRKTYIVIPIFYGLLFAVCGILALSAAGADSFLKVIQYVHIMGWVILLSQLCLALICCYFIMQTIKAYHAALAYDAIEIKE